MRTAYFVPVVPQTVPPERLFTGRSPTAHVYKNRKQSFNMARHYFLDVADTFMKASNPGSSIALSAVSMITSCSFLVDGCAAQGRWACRSVSTGCTGRRTFLGAEENAFACVFSEKGIAGYLKLPYSFGKVVSSGILAILSEPSFW